GGEAPAARAGLQTVAEMARLRRDDEVDLRGHTAPGECEAVIAERQSGRQAQFGPVALAGGLRAVLERAVPFSAADPCRQAQLQHRGGVLLRHDMDRGEAE